MFIDTSFDTRSYAGGKDPDSYSATLRSYHRYLWSKKLPNGKELILDEWLNNTSDACNFLFSSDSISNSLRGQKDYQHMISQIDRNIIEDFVTKGSTIGGYVIFPKRKINGKMSINQERGINSRICDRFDLTLECIRLYYLGKDSPLFECFKRYHEFFDLFVDFKGYIGFFLLQDLVDENYNVRFFLPFHDFSFMPRPTSTEEYLLYKENTISFVNSRNERISEWAYSEKR